MDLPDTTGLSWREGVYWCLRCDRARTRSPPPAALHSSMLPFAAQSSPPLEFPAPIRTPVSAPRPPVPAPHQRPPVSAPRECPQVPSPPECPSEPAPQCLYPAPASRAPTPRLPGSTVTCVFLLSFLFSLIWSVFLCCISTSLLVERRQSDEANQVVYVNLVPPREWDAASQGLNSGIPASACFIPRSWQRLDRTYF